MSRLLKLTPRVALPALAFGACSERRSATIPAPPAPSRIDSFQLPIPELRNRARTVRVYLPRGYARASAAFPVLYLGDAQEICRVTGALQWLCQ